MTYRLPSLRYFVTIAGVDQESVCTFSALEQYIFAKSLLKSLVFVVNDTGLV